MTYTPFRCSLEEDYPSDLYEFKSGRYLEDSIDCLSHWICDDSIYGIYHNAVDDSKVARFQRSTDGAFEITHR